MNRNLLPNLAVRLCAVPLMLLTVSCAVSGSRTRQSEQRLQTTETRQQNVSRQSARAETIRMRDAELTARHESLLRTFEAVPPEKAVVTIPLARLDSLPEGAQFGARSGRTSVEARRRGGALVVTARSDSLMRVVTRLERSENLMRREADSLRRRIDGLRTDTLARVAAGSVSQSGEQEVRQRRPSYRGWWFCAGAVAGIVGLYLIRRRGLLGRLF